MNHRCPHCNEIIFRTGRLDEHAFGTDAGDPQVTRNGADIYANCPACGQPVRMEAAPSETGMAYVVSRNQK